MSRQSRPTFRTILNQVADANLGKITSKAKTVNRVAKVTTGPNQSLAYQIKASLLNYLSQKFPQKVRVGIHLHRGLLLVQVPS